MEKIKGPITLASLYLLGYGVSPFFEVVWFTSLLFFLSPIPVFWMVYKILKDCVESDKRWEDGHFYDHP